MYAHVTSLLPLFYSLLSYITITNGKLLLLPPLPTITTTNHLSRRGTCLPQYDPCTPINYPNVCCPQTTFCILDASGGLACCPAGTNCTGEVLGGQGSLLQSGNTSGGGDVWNGSRVCEQGSVACGKEFPGACCKEGSVCGIGECVPGNGTDVASGGGGEVERLRGRFLLVAWTGVLGFVGVVEVWW